MTQPKDFSDKQCDLVTAFGIYVFDHAEMDNLLIGGPYVYFQVAGDTNFNSFSREMAERHRRDGDRVLMVAIDGLKWLKKGPRLHKPAFEMLRPQRRAVPRTSMNGTSRLRVKSRKIA